MAELAKGLQNLFDVEWPIIGLLKIDTPTTAKANIHFREATTPSQRSSITLRCLVMPNTLEHQKFVSTVSVQSI